MQTKLRYSCFVLKYLSAITLSKRKTRKGIVAWENTRDFATPPTRNDAWEKSSEIPNWWRVTTQIWVVLLIGWSKFWTNQKHYLYLNSVASSVWNFCTRFSVVISWGNQWWRCEISGVFSGWENCNLKLQATCFCLQKIAKSNSVLISFDWFTRILRSSVGGAARASENYSLIVCQAHDKTKWHLQSEKHTLHFVNNSMIQGCH